MIDHSILHPTSSISDVEQGVQIALQYSCASVCTVPHLLSICARGLSGSGVQPCTVIGFPHGNVSYFCKFYEIDSALDGGATELDMVINLGRLKSRDWTYVSKEIADAAQKVHSGRAKLKVIFETCYLSQAEKIELCKICSDSAVDWVKTSTGFGTSGATLEDLRLLRENTPPSVQVKASGGISTLDFILEAKSIGVTRIGTSRTVQILEQLSATEM